MKYLDRFKKYYDQFNEILGDLASEPETGGLQITNSSVQYVLLKGSSKPLYFSVRLPPGTLKNGQVRDYEKLTSALRELHSRISEANQDQLKRRKVVASIPSNVIYTQNFSVPKSDGARLEETASLNLEMISPIPSEEAYMSWEVIEESQDNLELLGAFIKKDILDDFKSALIESGFHPIAIEPPSLSLSWLVNKTLGPRDEALLVLNASSNGIDLFLLRNGYIYFDYFKSWSSIKSKPGQVSQETFKRAIAQEVQQVMSFSRSHFGEGLQKVYFIAPGMEKKVKNVVEQNFSVKAFSLRADFLDLDPSWYTAVGSAIRGGWERGKDKFISLGTQKVETVYYREQLIDFIQLWRNIFSGALVIFLILFGISAFILGTHPVLKDARVSTFDITPHEKELNDLREKVEKFNNLVSSVKEIKKNSGYVLNAIKELRKIANNYNVDFVDLSVEPSSNRLKISAEAPSYEQVVSFKDQLVSDERFSDVNLPFSNINTGPENFVTFNLGINFEASKD